MDAPVHPEAVLSFLYPDKIHISGPFNTPAPSLSASLAIFPHQASNVLSIPQLPPAKPSASTASDPFCQAPSSTQLTQNSRLAVLQKEKADLIKALNSHKTVLNNSNRSPEEETIPHIATVSCLRTVEKRAHHFEAENASLTEVSHEFIQKDLLASHNASRKKLQRLSAIIVTRLLGVSLKINPHLAYWLSR